MAAAAEPAKFVNLDMEEYRDLHLTVDAFRAALGGGGDRSLAGLDAGIVLQAYLPDTPAVLEELIGWAQHRYREHGGRGHPSTPHRGVPPRPHPAGRRRLAHGSYDRVRFIGTPEPEVLMAAHRAGVAVIRDPVVAAGAAEMPRWLREQAVSWSWHRHGNVRPAQPDLGA